MIDIIEKLRRYAGGLCISTSAEIEAADIIEGLRVDLEKERKEHNYTRLAAEAEQADRLRAKIEAMEKQEPYAFAVNFPESSRVELVHDLDEAYEDMTYEAYEVRKLYLAPGAQPSPNFADAYQGAMEDVAIWKKRALEAEDLNRKFVAEINGPAYMGEPAQPAPSAQDESVRKAWVRFSHELHRSPDAPYPGMSESFERHFSQSFTDREWRSESATWAAAWKAAKRHEAQAQLTPSVPECPYPCGWRNLLKHAIEDGAYLARSINEDEPVTENERAVTMRTVMRLRDVLMAINKAAPEKSK